MNIIKFSAIALAIGASCSANAIETMVADFQANGIAAGEPIDSASTTTNKVVNNNGDKYLQIKSTGPKNMGVKLFPYSSGGWSKDWTGQKLFKLDVLNNSGVDLPLLVKISDGDYITPIWGKVTPSSNSEYQTVEFAIPDPLPDGFDITNVFEINFLLDSEPNNGSEVTFQIDNIRLEDSKPSGGDIIVPGDDETVIVSFADKFNIGDTIDQTRDGFNEVSDYASSDGDGASWEVEYTAAWQGTTIYSEVGGWNVDWTSESGFKLDVLNGTDSAKIAIKLVSNSNGTSVPAEFLFAVPKDDTFHTVEIDFNELPSGFVLSNVTGVQSYLTQNKPGKVYYDSFRTVAGTIDPGPGPGPDPDPDPDVTPIVTFDKYVGKVIDTWDGVAPNIGVQDSDFDTDGDDSAWQISAMEDCEKMDCRLVRMRRQFVDQVVSWDWSNEKYVELDLMTDSTKDELVEIKLGSTGYTGNGWADFEDHVLTSTITVPASATSNTASISAFAASAVQTISIDLSATAGAKFDASKVEFIQIGVVNQPSNPINLYVDKIVTTSEASGVVPEDPVYPSYTGAGGSFGPLGLLFLPLLTLFRRRKS
ncbi:hypothetical protein AB4205_07655 [Vibrio sp. 10N.286.49.F3]|uniref:hypothetical protein n=1 Tax=unclassified Vibrio TaxID=2614977 RepID=UPI003551FE4E